MKTEEWGENRTEQNRTEQNRTEQKGEKRRQEYIWIDGRWAYQQIKAGENFSFISSTSLYYLILLPSSRRHTLAAIPIYFLFLSVILLSHPLGDRTSCQSTHEEYRRFYKERKGLYEFWRISGTVCKSFKKPLCQSYVHHIALYSTIDWTVVQNIILF